MDEWADLCCWLTWRRKDRRRAQVARTEQVLISGQFARRSGTAAKRSFGEIARFRIDPHRVLAFAVAKRTMAADAISAIVLATAYRIADELANMARGLLDRQPRS